MKDIIDPLALSFEDIDVLPLLDRREFLRRAGAGIFVFVTLGDLVRAADPEQRRTFRPQQPDDFNAFLRVGEDGRVSCFLGKTEMGQGIQTSMAQLVAEELDVELDRIDMVLSDTGQCPWDLGTFGSMSIRFVGPTLRKAGAEARRVLMALGAERLAVDPREVTTQAGRVCLRADPSRCVAYADLAKGKQIRSVVEGEAVLRAAGDFRVIGRSEVARDSWDKVRGAALYTADLRRPGMLYARILRPPAHDSVLRSVDTAAAEAIPGVQLVRDGDRVAVLHADPETAAAALAAVRADWEIPEATVDDRSIFEALRADVSGERKIAAAGDLAAGEKTSVHLITSQYLDGYVAHAPIETHSAVAEVSADSATIWASTQTPFMVRDSVASLLGLEPGKVRIIAPYVGGGFGGKGRSPQADEAAWLSRATGSPVMVAWTREEEFFFDTFRPAAVVEIKGGVDADGKLSMWDFRVHHAGTRGAGQFYAIPHHRTRSFGSGWRGRGGPHPFGVGAWRAPANNTNTFARESHIDQLAHAAKIDPYEFRMRNLQDRRMRQALQTAAEKFGWQRESTAPAASGRLRGRGIACGIDAGTWVAMIAEVEVDPSSGRVQVERVGCAQDMGLVVNPRGARMQAEGCITMGLGYALSEQLRFRGGEIFDRNFDSYQLPRFSSVPEIEVELIDSEVAEAQGGGEPAIVTVGGAIANAIFDACGARLFEMPMTPERVRAALT